MCQASKGRQYVCSQRCCSFRCVIKDRDEENGNGTDVNSEGNTPSNSSHAGSTPNPDTQSNGTLNNPSLGQLHGQGHRDLIGDKNAEYSKFMRLYREMVRAWALRNNVTFQGFRLGNDHANNANGGNRFGQHNSNNNNGLELTTLRQLFNMTHDVSNHTDETTTQRQTTVHGRHGIQNGAAPAHFQSSTQPNNLNHGGQIIG